MAGSRADYSSRRQGHIVDRAAGRPARYAVVCDAVGPENACARRFQALTGSGLMGDQIQPPLDAVQPARDLGGPVFQRCQACLDGDQPALQADEARRNGLEIAVDGGFDPA
jgi:hypothetical protein